MDTIVVSVKGSDGTDHRQAWDFSFEGEIHDLVDAEGYEVFRDKTNSNLFKVVFPQLRSREEAAEWVQGIGGELVAEQSEEDPLEGLFGPR